MQNMPLKGMITGSTLILLGLIGYFGGGRTSLTALIPSLFGLLIFLSSLFAQKPKYLKLGSSLASSLGLLGFLVPLRRLLPQISQGEFELGFAPIAMILMVAICGVFTFSCIRAFRAVRLKKN